MVDKTQLWVLAESLTRGNHFIELLLLYLTRQAVELRPTYLVHLCAEAGTDT